MLDTDTVAGLTQDWLNLFEKDKSEGKDLANSVFWRLALHSLPVGVDETDPRVKSVIDEIRKAVEAKTNA